MHRPALLLSLVLATALPPVAQAEGGTPSAAPAEAPPYTDDRTDAAAVLRSYYNAIDRGEYARAWSYWLPATPPVADFAAFSAGFAGTVGTDLVLGTATGEGAAGSLYSTLPVAFDALQQDGSVETYAGCFVLRLAQPALQAAPPFQPLHIESADLRAVDGPAEAAVPDTCPET